MSIKRRGIGGTDVGPIVAMYRPELAPDLAKWANATDVAMRIAFDIERPRTKVMSRGLDAEPRLRKAYVDAFPCAMVAKPEEWIVPHPTAPWATCSPDDARTDGVLVEYKSTSIFAIGKWGEPESDEVPPLYGLQVQWCLGILDLPLAHLFVGFGRDFDDESGEHQFLYEQTRRYVIPRDPELFAMAFGYCERFQKDFIEPRKLPPLVPVNNRRAYSQLLKGSHPCQTQTEAPPSP